MTVFVRVLASVALLILGCWGATFHIAETFRGHEALGEAWFARVYAPWAIVDWSRRWADDFPNEFFAAHLIVGVAFVAACAVHVRSSSAKLAPFAEKAWAGWNDVADAGLFARSGAVLGKFDGEVLCYDGPEHHLLIGASRSGKGRGHVVPTLLAWSGSALVLDIKSELAFGDARHGFPGVAGFRQTLGPVMCFAPTRAASCAFNPLFEVRRGADEVRDVQNIVEVIVDPAGDRRNEDFWDRSAKQVLTGVILHVLYTETPERKTLAVVRERLADLDTTAQEMAATLHRQCPTSGELQTHPEVALAATSYLSGEERLRSGVKATAQSFFGVFADPIVAEKTSRSDFRVGDLMCGERPVTLFLQPPPSDAARLMPLMRLVINLFARALMEDQAKDARGCQKRHRLLFMLDEFPQLGRMPFFETAMGAMAGYGIKVYLVCQSLNHIVRAYGRENVLVDNCHVVVAFAAADTDTAKRIAEMAGEVWEMRPQRSDQRPKRLIGSQRGSVTYREERRPLLLAGDVRALKRDEQLVFVSGAKPLRCKKLRFDTEPVFVSRLCPWAPSSMGEAPGVQHDWGGVRVLGRRAPRPSAKTPAPAKQGSLFGDGAPQAPRPRSRGI